MIATKAKRKIAINVSCERTRHRNIDGHLEDFFLFLRNRDSRVLRHDFFEIRVSRTQRTLVVFVTSSHTRRARYA